MIPEKVCIDCDETINTFATFPRCKHCTMSKCAFRHTPDSLNRIYCNHMVDLIFRDDQIMCIGHYKKLQKFCRICGSPKKFKDHLSYDNWYYCDLHKPKVAYRNKVIKDILSPYLCNDSLDIIIRLL